MLVLFLQKKKEKTAATTKNIKKVLTVFGGLNVVTAFTANG